MSDFGVNALLKRFGQAVMLCQQEVREDVYAVIQPLLYKNKMYLGGKATPIGLRDEGHLLMIASLPRRITDWGKVVVTSKNGSYTVKSAQVVSSGKESLYIWAVITPCKEEAEDDYDEFDRCA